jgi:hypothetical protein
MHDVTHFREQSASETATGMEAREVTGIELTLLD